MNTKRFNYKKIFLAIGLLFICIQFIRIDKSNPVTQQETDFIFTEHPSPGVTNILKASCYDCHSNETTYPWYTDVAPVSWWIKDHINEARHHLNFSEWKNFSSKKRDHKLKECVELVGENEMPLYSYTLIHKNAQLNADQQHALTVWFESLRTYESEHEK